MAAEDKPKCDLTVRAAVTLFKEIARQRLLRIEEQPQLNKHWNPDPPQNVLNQLMGAGVTSGTGRCTYVVNGETFTVEGVTDAECRCLGGTFSSK